MMIEYIGPDLGLTMGSRSLHTGDRIEDPTGLYVAKAPQLWREVVEVVEATNEPPRGLAKGRKAKE